MKGWDKIGVLKIALPPDDVSALTLYLLPDVI